MRHRILRFLFLTCALPAALGAQDLRPEAASPPSSPPPPPAQSRVVVAENPGVVQRFQPDAAQVRAMVNRCLLALTKKRTTAEAWRTFVSPSDTVGIKISTAGGPILSTHAAVLETVIAGLREAGVPEGRIIVWDKFEDQMLSAGQVPLEPRGRWRTLSVIPGVGFDGEAFYFHELAGQLIWGDRDFVGRAELKADSVQRLIEAAAIDPKKTKDLPGNTTTSNATKTPPQLSNRSYFTRIATREVTKIIHLPVLSDHDRIGIWGAVSSLALGSVDNHRRFLDDSEAAATGIAEILANETLSSKTVLHLMDGLVAQYAGGPAFHPHYAATPGLLLASTDPVAIDTLALERIEDWRRGRGVVPVGDKARHLAKAAALGLGKNQRAQIEVTVVP